MGGADRHGLIGETIDGRYLVTGIIGEGGMGTVYRAQHIRIGRVVAIKVLHPEYAADAAALEGFFGEARAAATLEHPNIAAATDMGELADNSPYLVLELLEGRSLHDEIDYVGRLSVRRSLQIARQIASGVGAAHDAGIIHRDLKSDNVFLTERDGTADHVKIFDFGVAWVLGRFGNGPSEKIVGTPEFMPPEQITEPTSLDVRADVYAVGAILYHMLAGKPPYSEAGLTVMDLLEKVLAEDPAPVSGVPEDVRALVQDAMTRDRTRRIESAAVLLQRIDQIVPTGPSSPSIRANRERSAVASSPKRATGASRQAIVAAPTFPTGGMSGPAPSPPGSTRWPYIALGIGLLIAAGGGVYGLSSAMNSSSARSESSLAAAGSQQQPVAVPEPEATAVKPAEVPPTDVPPTNVAPTTVPPTNVPPIRTTGHPRDSDLAPAPPAPPVVESPPGPHAPSRPAAHVTAPVLHARKLDKPATPSSPTKPESEVKTAKIEPRPEANVTEARPADVAKPPEPVSKPPTQAIPSAPPNPAAPKPGTIDLAATRAAIRPHLGAIQRCFERAKMDDASLAGSVTIRIAIGPDGKVTSADVSKSTLGSPATEHCITREISSWQLPSAGGVASSLTYPFVFE